MWETLLKYYHPEAHQHQELYCQLWAIARKSCRCYLSAKCKGLKRLARVQRCFDPNCVSMFFLALRNKQLRFGRPMIRFLTLALLSTEFIGNMVVNVQSRSNTENEGIFYSADRRRFNMDPKYNKTLENAIIHIFWTFYYSLPKKLWWTGSSYSLITSWAWILQYDTVIIMP